MTLDTLDAVEAELERCGARLRAVRARHTVEGDRIFYGSAETATLRRASMEFTKALARLRRG